MHIRLLRTETALIVLASAMLGYVMTTGEVYPHDGMSGMPYDPWCCNGDANTGDCQKIPSSSVRPIDGGYGITLRPGDHRKVTKPHSYSITQDKVRPSIDGNFHACLFPTEENLRCFFAPPPGS